MVFHNSPNEVQSSYTVRTISGGAIVGINEIIYF